MRTIPDEVAEEGFYEPNQLGFEKKIKERIDYWQQIKAKLKEI
jgi:replication-associated recombination protein RarA